VIVPCVGGASSFARHGKNALLVNSHSHQACVSALNSLITQTQYRRDLAVQGQQDIQQFTPQKAARHLLTVVSQFGKE